MSFKRSCSDVDAFASTVTPVNAAHYTTEIRHLHIIDIKSRRSPLAGSACPCSMAIRFSLRIFRECLSMIYESLRTSRAAGNGSQSIILFRQYEEKL